MREMVHRVDVSMHLLRIDLDQQPLKSTLVMLEVLKQRAHTVLNIFSLDFVKVDLEPEFQGVS